MLLPLLILTQALVAAPVAPPADLTLKGVIAAAGDQRGVAVLSSGGRTRVASVGDEVFGGRLAAVLAQGVTLDFGGRTVTLTVPSPGRVPTVVGTRPEPGDVSAPPVEAERPRQIARVEAERRLALEMKRILTETTLVPVREGDKVAGVEVRRIAAGSLLTDAGLREGDVITEINGTHIDGLPTLIALYGRLQTATELRAVVLRRGVPTTIAVDLK